MRWTIGLILLLSGCLQSSAPPTTPDAIAPVLPEPPTFAIDATGSWTLATDEARAAVGHLDANAWTRLAGSPPGTLAIPAADSTCPRAALHVVLLAPNPSWCPDASQPRLEAADYLRSQLPGMPHTTLTGAASLRITNGLTAEVWHGACPPPGAAIAFLHASGLCDPKAATIISLANDAPAWSSYGEVRNTADEGGLTVLVAEPLSITSRQSAWQPETIPTAPSDAATPSLPTPAQPSTSTAPTAPSGAPLVNLTRQSVQERAWQGGTIQGSFRASSEYDEARLIWRAPDGHLVDHLDLPEATLVYDIDWTYAFQPRIAGNWTLARIEFLIQGSPAATALPEETCVVDAIDSVEPDGPILFQVTSTPNPAREGQIVTLEWQITQAADLQQITGTLRGPKGHVIQLHETNWQGTPASGRLANTFTLPNGTHGAWHLEDIALATQTTTHAAAWPQTVLIQQRSIASAWILNLTNGVDQVLHVQNPTRDPQDMSGFRITNKAGNTYTFPPETLLSSSHVLRLHSATGQDTATDKFWGRPGIWSAADEARLLSPDGILVDHYAT